MKLFSKVLVLLLAFGVAIMSPHAKSISDYTLIGGESTYILKYDTEGTFYTCVTPSSQNDNITIENTVQRENILGTWKNVARAYLTLNKSEIGRDHNVNYYFSKTADTRSIWANMTSGTKTTANFYINNGSEYDIDFQPTYIG